ncbi:MAG: DUF3299 domain-containing protein [Acidimicrobiales bacterium]
MVTALPGEADRPQYGDSLDEYFTAKESGSEPSAQSGSDAPTAPALAGPAALDGFQELTWEELVPPGFSGQEIYARYEERLAALEDGSPEANELYEEMQAEYDDDAVNTQLDGKNIQLAGFVAPLSYDDDIITEFLLVPYFGACIHVPPPPPNQTIMVTLDKAEGLTIEESWGAVWVAGSLTASSATTDLATAGYTITGATSGVYENY